MKTIASATMSRMFGLSFEVSAKTLTDTNHAIVIANAATTNDVRV